MAETLTRGEAQNVITGLQNQIKSLDASIKSQGIGSTVLQLLNESKTTIQSKLDEIMKKGGIVTEDDYNSAYNAIKKSEEAKLLKSKKQETTKLVIFGLVVLAIIGGVIYYKHRKK